MYHGIPFVSRIIRASVTLTQRKQRIKSLLTASLDLIDIRLFNLLAALIAYSAGSLACRLARSLALAAAALFHGFL
jgi:hypothetical protein